MHQSHRARGARRRFAVCVVACVAMLATAIAVPLVHASAATAAFVSRCGIHFCLGGHTYYFAGANVYDTFTYGGSYGDTETLQRHHRGARQRAVRLPGAEDVATVPWWVFPRTWLGCGR